MPDTVELQLKKVPPRIKSLIGREAELHHHSLNQEAIALLEEALLAGAKAQQPAHDEINEILDRFDKLPSLDPRPLSEMTKFDALGLPE